LLTDRAVRAAVRAAFALAPARRPPPSSVDVVLADDRTLARIHGRFLADPAPTDVIAFDLADEDDARGVGGEIYANAQCARRVAARRGVGAERELCLYVVHGALHLCGFDDRSPADRRRMRRAEARVMNTLDYAPDRGPHE
jgi:probable rRNA maturation factor